MDKEYLYLPGDRDGVSDPIELKGGTAALLYIKGGRPTQQDALWAGTHDGKLVICSSDGTSFPAGGEKMAEYVVEYGSEYARAQIKETGTVDVLDMQNHIRESISQYHPLHTGRATSLCMVIDAPTVHAHRVGDPDTRINDESFPHPALVPETKGSEAFRTWWSTEGRYLEGAEGGLEVLARLAQERRRLFNDIRSVEARTITNTHSGINSSRSEAFISPFAAKLPLVKRSRLVAGPDGLENVRLNNWYATELPAAFTPQHFLTDLWSELERRNGENASGVAFFCDK